MVSEGAQLSRGSAFPRETNARAVLWGSLVLGVLLKARIVFSDDGINWPDEIYQSFEPAHRLVFGHGLVAWEFIEGARTWAVPGFVAIWLFICKLFGAGPSTYIPVVKLAFVALSAGASLGVYRLARGFGGRELESAVASALWSLCALSLYFSARAMSENLAAPLVVWGLALIFEEGSQKRTRIVGAALLGAATIVRLQCAVFCIGALVVLLAPLFMDPKLRNARFSMARRVSIAGVGAVVLISLLATRIGPEWSFRLLVLAGLAALGGIGVLVFDLMRAAPVEKREPVREVFLTLVVAACVLGIWDAAAWHSVPTAKVGGLFHSAVVYWRFNIVENRGAGWGTAPWTYYFQHLYLTMPGVALVLGASLLGSARKAWPLVVSLVLFLALHFYVGHKELRFMIPVMPLVCAAFGIAVSLLPSQPARIAMVVAALCVGVSALNHKTLTMGDVGSYPERAQSSAWDDFGPVNRLMLAASRQSDVCGLRIDAAHLAWTGGTTYLHHNAPLYMPGFPQQHGFFNYVLTRAGSGAPVIASEAGLELVRLGPTCTPDVAYAWRLP
ncbi:MAG: hypothetical protein JNM17_25240 [Archangium sp.]|nr:hypothetical protein [Archangium sp.]